MGASIISCAGTNNATEISITRAENIRSRRVFTLYLTDDEVLKRRVLTESRDSGLRDYEQSIAFNKKLRDELQFENEYKLDNTTQSPQQTADQIISILDK